MMLNPELRRNVWLDFSFHRLILAPLVIILIVSLFHLTGGNESSASIAFNLACLFIFLWGTKKASETVIDEVNNNTWDFQRQSSISPWSMTWGKLFGSTLFSWYATLCSLLFYLSFQVNPHLREIFVLLLGGILGQALALLFSLQLLPQVRREKNNKSFRYFLAGALLGILMTTYCFKAIHESPHLITWHHTQFASDAFAIASLILFSGWALIGLQRSFCRELQYQNIPWVWVLFNIFCMSYFSGLVSFEKINLSILNIPELKDIGQQLTQLPWYVAFFIGQTLTYLALFTDEITTIRYKHFLARLREKNRLESFQQLPWWVISIILTVVAGIAIACQETPSGSLLEKFSPAVFILTSILFVFRDIFLIHFFNFGKYPKKAMGAAVVYLFLLYFLFPLLLNALHLNSLFPAFLPSWGQNTPLAIISSGAQIALLGMLCIKRWEKRTQTTLETSVKKA